MFSIRTLFFITSFLKASLGFLDVLPRVPWKDSSGHKQEMNAPNIIKTSSIQPNQAIFITRKYWDFFIPSEVFKNFRAIWVSSKKIKIIKNKDIFSTNEIIFKVGVD